MARIRVTLRWIKILDNLEPFFKETGRVPTTSSTTTCVSTVVPSTTGWVFTNPPTKVRVTLKP